MPARAALTPCGAGMGRSARPGGQRAKGQAGNGLMQAGLDTGSNLLFAQQGEGDDIAAECHDSRRAVA